MFLLVAVVAVAVDQQVQALRAAAQTNGLSSQVAQGEQGDKAQVGRLHTHRLERAVVVAVAASARRQLALREAVAAHRLPRLPREGAEHPARQALLAAESGVAYWSTNHSLEAAVVVAQH